MKKKIIISISILIALFLIILCVKFSNFGNNNINQDSVKDIFNMQEYEAEIEATITSNKNENKYKIKEQYTKSEEKATQEVLEPEDLKGVKIIKQGAKITLENTQLNLSKIFEECNGIVESDMNLLTFIKNYKENTQQSSMEEKNKEIILKTKSNSNNKHLENKVLYIDKTTGKPTKMEIKDTNKKTIVYIVYNKVEIK